jgi:polar amino acid transport system substrate-binding protein
MKRAAIIGALMVLFPVGQALTQQVSDSRVADLASIGKLRAGVGVVAPHWDVKDLGTGQLRGVIARALAAGIGIELSLVEYPSPPAVLDGVNTKAWDVGFLASDPSRAVVVDFSPRYLQIDATYLVPPGSSIRDTMEVDKPGVRIAVTAKSVEEIVLRSTLKMAELRAVETIPAALELVASIRTSTSSSTTRTMIEHYWFLCL